MGEKRTVCLAAIISDEDPFIDEWLIYHYNLGVEHFFLYDDDPRQHLKELLRPHNRYVTVIPWFGTHINLPGRNRQTKAYLHFTNNFSRDFEWVGFLDIDEFVVLNRHENLVQFLAEYPEWGAVSLNWHVFGHNGYYDDPAGLITSALTRRKLEPSKNVKTFSRSNLIEDITTAHFCRLAGGVLRADCNKHEFTELVYPGKTAVAHINHYQCRSFLRWMKRHLRGDVSIDDVKKTGENHQWKLDEEGCLRQFVTTVALDKNEYVDEYMLKYTHFLTNELKKLKCITNE